MSTPRDGARLTDATVSPDGAIFTDRSPDPSRMPSPALTDLLDHLKSVFQFENNDLDFGIYKVLRLKQAEVSAFLDDELGEIVEAELKKAATGASDAKYQRLATYVREETGPKYHALVVSPQSVAENQGALRGLVEGAEGEADLVDAIDGGVGIDPELEDRVYNHLLAFFQRYYRDGDFGYNDRSLATYKVDYPPAEADYDGSDVLLNWKHKDSYYIKSANGFPTVRVEVDGKAVEYRLETGGAADEKAKTRNNNKDDGRKHYGLDRVETIETEQGPVVRVVFRLAERSTPKADVLAAVMAEAFGVEDGLDPYLYRPAKKDEERGKPAFNDLEGDYDRVENGSVKGQGQLRQALDTYLNGIVGHDQFKALGSNNNKRKAALADDETAQKLHTLDQHLNKFYVGVNADYFVHKDLGGFLRREAGRYVKDVILSGVEGLLSEDRDETAFLIARAFYRVAERIIGFLAATEDFQKNLFLLKKKVVQTDWLVSIGKLAEWIEDDTERTDLLAEVHASDGLRAEWKETFGVEVADPSQLLLAYPTLPINTRHLDDALTLRLISACPDIEGETTGLLLNSENLQALRLLADSYRQRVQCIYIDPPYNTGGDGFLYKDSFRHSSWLSMMQDRIEEGRDMLSNRGVLFASIDEREILNLRSLTEEVFGSKSHAGTLVWKGATDNNPTRVATEHEYVLCFVKDPMEASSVWQTPVDGSKQTLLDQYDKLRRRHGADDEAVQNGLRSFIKKKEGSISGVTHYNLVDQDGPYTGSRKVHNPGKEGYRYDVLHPETKKPTVQPARGYRYPEEAMTKMVESGRIIFGDDENQIVQIKEYLSDYKASLKSVYHLDGRVAANVIADLFGSREVFSSPKPVELLTRFLSFVTEASDVVADFFAGSGTTGHSVLRLNKDDGADRRFVLVEMGEYFEQVLLERIRRVMYSLDWKDGEPKGSQNGTIGLVKVQTVESYEDVLDALVPADDAGGSDVPIQYLYRPEEQTVRSSLNLTRPFGNEIRVGKDGETRTVDVLETYAYFQGLPVRQVGTHTGDREIRWFQSGRHLVAFRDIEPGDDDTADLIALLDSREGAEVLHVNEYVDERQFAERSVSLRVVTASDFDKGASWS